ncbi:Uncharacterized protein PBTT_09165 [Plasmodiophora brassicae]
MLGVVRRATRRIARAPARFCRYESTTRVGERGPTKVPNEDEVDRIVEDLGGYGQCVLQLWIAQAMEDLEARRGSPIQLRHANMADRIRLFGSAETKTLTISQNGLGKTKQDLQDALGPLMNAKEVDLEKYMDDEATTPAVLLRQRFVSTFFVAHRVEIFARSFLDDAHGTYWCTEAMGPSNADFRKDDVEMGMKVVLHLRDEYMGLTEADHLRRKVLALCKSRMMISNHIFPVFVNGRRVSVIGGRPLNKEENEPTPAFTPEEMEQQCEPGPTSFKTHPANFKRDL